MEPSNRLQAPFILLLACILLFGAWLRLPTNNGWPGTGFDEHVYSIYVDNLNKAGLLNYPDICDHYLEEQGRTPTAFLPPTRVLFLSSCALWSRLFHSVSPAAVHGVSCVASCLLMLAAALWAWRLGGPVRSIGVAALMACAPLEIHMAHRAWVDSFFALWALLSLWSFWEALQTPNHRGWLTLYTASLAAMILTKENAFFVFAAICGLLVANRWLRFGTVAPTLALATVLGVVLASVVLVFATGGLETLIAVLRMNVEKSKSLPYAIATGNGPWHRYLVDLILLNPLLMLLAIAAGLNAGRQTCKAGLFLALFFAFTYLIMAQIKGGMNLRYGNIWSFPLAWLALSQIFSWASAMTEKWRAGFVILVLCCLSASELWQYHLLFVRGKIYDPVTIELGWSQKMFQFPPPAREPKAQNQ